MRKCLIIGGGIEAIVTALMIKKNQADVDITIKTINSDPRLVKMNDTYGATWSGLSPRHITYFEGYNRNLLKLNDLVLKKKISDGGWLGKDHFSHEEKAWIARRIATQNFTSFNKELLKFYEGYNAEAIKIWHELIASSKELFCNTQIKYGITKLHSNPVSKHTRYQEFSLSIHHFAINALNYLGRLGVHLLFETRVTSLSSTEDFQDVIIAVGAYGSELLKNTSAVNRICAVAGAWLSAKATPPHHNFQLCTEDLWQQNYSHVGNNNYVIGTGYGLAGFDTKSLTKIEKDALIARSVKLAQKFCTEIKPSQKICFRSFTDNDLPLINIEKNSRGGKIIIIGGMNTGTTTASPHTGQIVSDILQNKKNTWITRLNLFNEGWNNFISNYKTHQCYM